MKAVLNKLKSMPAVALMFIIACWAYRWTEGSFPNGWDAVPLLVGMFASWLLLRPEQPPSRAKGKWCKWLDHRYESDDSYSGRDKDFPSAKYDCKRCGHSQGENEWEGELPGTSLRKKFVICLVVIVVLAACALPLLAKDAEIYLDVVAGKGCCGFVSESWIERPVTRAMVEWDNPYWSVNEEKSERWLVSEGMVNGETKFLRILKREPLSNTQP
ncbi:MULTISPECIES: hypothetical protein [unclassified Pseudomonas]|uniref:hypothetical protein n=1 Tax=unclassified Pseudomonas TaxID=196821 RepID=UPI001CBB9164|nr:MULTISPECIES: hypothetical protein [unclassified Pseudomonas]